MLIGYGRVSRDNQNESLQRDALESAGCERIYMDKESRLTKDRPQLDEMLRAARPGDVVTVWRLDRLGGSLAHLIHLLETFRDGGIDFRSVTEGIDTTTPAGQLVYHITGAFAQFEVSVIRERTLAGLAAARARGRVGGRRPKMSLGDARKARAMLSDPDERKASVAEHFGVSRPTLDSALKRLEESEKGKAAKPSQDG